MDPEFKVLWGHWQISVCFLKSYFHTLVGVTDQTVRNTCLSAQCCFSEFNLSKLVVHRRRQIGSDSQVLD